MRSKSFITLTAVVLVVGTLAGGAFSRRAFANDWENEKFIRSFATILQVVQDNYFEPVEPDVPFMWSLFQPSFHRIG